MPRKPKSPCRYPGCPNLSDGVYCEKHRGLYARENAHRRGYQGLRKQIAKLNIMFALANLILADRPCLAA